MSGATFAGIIVRRRGLVALAWILACVFLLPRARRIESVLRVAARVDGSESAAVDEQLALRFQSPFAHSVVLVGDGDSFATNTARRRRVARTRRLGAGDSRRDSGAFLYRWQRAALRRHTE